MNRSSTVITGFRELRVGATQSMVFRNSPASGTLETCLKTWRTG
ncbi:UNVERIFIED_CONTAM: hypothetical protein ABID98_002957 [Brevibacillus sp. OAP136]